MAGADAETNRERRRTFNVSPSVVRHRVDDEHQQESEDRLQEEALDLGHPVAEVGDAQGPLLVVRGQNLQKQSDRNPQNNPQLDQ